MRYFTGIQPSGRLHLGNYFSAIRPILAAAEAGHDVFVFVADYHALTTQRDPLALRENVSRLCREMVACGLGKCHLFRQSDVPEIAEIALLLGMFARLGNLQRSHAFSDKIKKGVACDLGLLTYPILMAADILACEAEVVPVGQDQQQHLEIAVDTAKRVNNLFKGVFPIIPKGQLSRSETLPGVDGKKMSKSAGNYIAVFEDYADLRKKINSIVSEPVGIADPKPKNSPILALYRQVASDAEYLEMEASFDAGGVGYGHYKSQLLDKMDAFIAPLRDSFASVSQADVDNVFACGAAEARKAARRVLGRFRSAVGLAVPVS